jgi:hypothetical protein
MDLSLRKDLAEYLKREPTAEELQAAALFTKELEEDEHHDFPETNKFLQELEEKHRSVVQYQPPVIIPKSPPPLEFHPGASKSPPPASGLPTMVETIHQSLVDLYGMLQREIAVLRDTNASNATWKTVERYSGVILLLSDYINAQPKPLLSPFVVTFKTHGITVKGVRNCFRANKATNTNKERAARDRHQANQLMAVVCGRVLMMLRNEEIKREMQNKTVSVDEASAIMEGELKEAKDYEARGVGKPEDEESVDATSSVNVDSPAPMEF